MQFRSYLVVRCGVYALVGGLAATIAIGIPTAVIVNPWFRRMTPTRPLDIVFLLLTSTLTAALAATWAYPATCAYAERSFSTGSFLSFLAIGCPVCNKLVVLLLGFSGALTFFAPLQPVLGLASVALLAYALRTRLRAIRETSALSLT